MPTYTITLRMPDGERTFECPDNEYILDMAEDHGLDDLPWGCRSGTCGSCMGRLISGRVEQDQVALSDEMVADGYIVLCSSEPRSDCLIETHQHDKLTLGGG